MKIYIGCSGYHYKDWKGNFYPEDLKKNEWFGYYSGRLNSVEINNTFYKIPETSALKRWIDQTPDDFRFSVKGSRYITHMKKLNDAKPHLDKFYRSIEPLKVKTDVILWQLPGNLRKNTDKLETFCDHLNQKYINVIEFRHKSWFDEKVYDILKNYNVTVCSLSAPGDLPNEIFHQTGRIYLRFHGKNDWYKDNYADEELKDWGKRIKKTNADEVYIYFNNDYHANAAHNAIKLKELMDLYT